MRFRKVCLGLTWPLALAWALASAAPPTEDLPELLVPIRAASEAGRVGQITGTVAFQRRTPRDPPVAVPDVTLVLLPRSAALVRELEQVKRNARESEARYLRAVTDMLQLAEQYQQAIRKAGAGGLVFSVKSDPGGEFVFSRVPAGEWLLLGRHDVLHPMPPPRLRRRERETFLLGPLAVGYRTVTYWLRELRVVQGDPVRVELTDRNPWFTGILQEREKPSGQQSD